jgi:disulfide bond formation protein DsbB
LKWLACPFAVFALIALTSFLALAAALGAEIILGLEPCILCIYQRIPFAAALLFSLFGLALCKWKPGRRKNLAIKSLLFSNAFIFLTNSAIAAYHTGVERHWWRSMFEGCAVPNLSDEPQTLLENILSAPSARCDEIPWADPLLGLSMANYNVLLCMGLFALCLAAALMIRPSPAGSLQP